MNLLQQIEWASSILPTTSNTTIGVVDLSTRVYAEDIWITKKCLDNIPNASEHHPKILQFIGGLPYFMTHNGIVRTDSHNGFPFFSLECHISLIEFPSINSLFNYTINKIEKVKDEKFITMLDELCNILVVKNDDYFSSFSNMVAQLKFDYNIPLQTILCHPTTRSLMLKTAAAFDIKYLPWLQMDVIVSSLVKQKEIYLLPQNVQCGFISVQEQGVNAIEKNTWRLTNNYSVKQNVIMCFYNRDNLFKIQLI